jgi:hypothetical protein
VYAPGFDRTIEQPIAGQIPAFPQTRVVVTEGNYLLDETGPWPAVRRLLDEFWLCDVDDATRQERLVRRHISSAGHRGRLSMTPAPGVLGRWSHPASVLVPAADGSGFGGSGSHAVTTTAGISPIG